MKFGGCLMAFSVFASSSVAADFYSPVTPEARPIEVNGWTLTVAPYFWMAGLSGDIAQFGGPTISIDRSFTDIIEDFDVGGMAIGEAHHGRFSIIGDVMYTRISSSKGTLRGIAASSADVSSDTFIGFAGAGYSLLESDPIRIDIIGGIRIWSVDTDIAISGGILDGLSISDGATWVDGMVGMRGSYAVNPTIFLTGWAFMGMGSADADWDVAAAVGYHINGRFSALAGYRSLGVDYDNDGFVFDIVQQGPIIGLSMHF